MGGLNDEYLTPYTTGQLERLLTKMYAVTKYAELAHDHYNTANSTEGIFLLLSGLSDELNSILESIKDRGRGKECAE